MVSSADRPQLRVLLGTVNGVLKRQIRPGEYVIVHTHPVYASRPKHFFVDLDPRRAGKCEEAVLDWSGAVTCLKDGKIKNPVTSAGYVDPLPDEWPPFMDPHTGDIVGYSTFTEDGAPEHKRRRQ